MRICIFGAASSDIHPAFIRSAEAISRALAREGHSLVFGGGCNGLMGAAARGFAAENAEIIGVIPHFLEDEGIEPVFSEKSRLIYTETMHERKAKMEELADAFLILPGGTGTLEEFFEVLTLKKLGRHEKPILVFSQNGYYDPIRGMLERVVEEKFSDSGLLDCCRFCSSEEEILSEFKKEK